VSGWQGIRAVCFDLGGTLVRVDGDPTTRQVANLLGLSLTQARQWMLAGPKRSRVSAKELAQQISAAFGRPDINDDVEKVLLKAKERALAPELFPDVERTLTRLRTRGYRLYGLSNALGSSAPATAPTFHNLLDEVHSSYDTGWCKPEQQAFAAVQEAVGLPGHQLLHVGDSPTADAAGALAAGWHAVLLTRPETARTHHDPDRRAPRIRTLSTLLHLLPAIN
jgi:putative hydrolase of the HAD superfamily